MLMKKIDLFVIDFYLLYLIVICIWGLFKYLKSKLLYKNFKSYFFKKDKKGAKDACSLRKYNSNNGIIFIIFYLIFT